MQEPLCGVCLEPFDPTGPPLICEACGLQVHAPCYGYPAFPFPTKTRTAAPEPVATNSRKPFKRIRNMERTEKLIDGHSDRRTGQTAWRNLAWLCAVCWARHLSTVTPNESLADSRIISGSYAIQEGPLPSSETTAPPGAQRIEVKYHGDHEHGKTAVEALTPPDVAPACMLCPLRDYRLAVKPLIPRSRVTGSLQPINSSGYLHIVCALADPNIEPVGTWECLNAFQHRADEGLHSDFQSTAESSALNEDASRVAWTPQHVSRRVLDKALDHEPRATLECALCERSTGLRFFCWVPPGGERDLNGDTQMTCSVVFHPICALVAGWWRPEPRFVFQGHLRVSCPRHAIFALRAPIPWLGPNESADPSPKLLPGAAFCRMIESLYLPKNSSADAKTVLLCLEAHILPQTYEWLRSALSELNVDTAIALVQLDVQKVLAAYTEEMQVAIVLLVAERLGLDPELVLRWLEKWQISAELLRWIQSDFSAPGQPTWDRNTRRDHLATRGDNHRLDGVNPVPTCSFAHLWARLLDWPPQRPYPQHCGWVDTTERPLCVQARALFEHTGTEA